MAEPLDLADIQGNLMRGYRMENARHLALAVSAPALARRFIADLVSGDEARAPQVSTEEHWEGKPLYRLNLGVTWPGLKALGVPSDTLAAFPAAFREGAAMRSAARDPDFPAGVGLGDVGDSAPEHWVLGGYGNEVHMMLSLYTNGVEALERISGRLRGLFNGAGVTELQPAHDANALDDGTLPMVHFGYRDGIAQPRIQGAPSPERPDMQPEARPGDFLLGCDYVNIFGGNYLGSLPHALGDNATYAAFRILRQDVAGFERLLSCWSREYGMTREMVAAKLLGRWRDGTPLSLSPDSDEPVDNEQLNNFDYAAVDGHRTFYDDAAGRRCPIGAHIRRLNPRGSLVMGLPHSRRIIRRGMPYGPPFDPEAPEDGVERGLVGMFVCGDLELQYEFILRVWANQDLATQGLRGTREPILGAQPGGSGTFVVRTDDARDPIVMRGLERLVQTRASVYCMVPGIGGLRYLASAPEGPVGAR